MGIVIDMKTRKVIAESQSAPAPAKPTKAKQAKIKVMTSIGAGTFYLYPRPNDHYYETLYFSTPGNGPHSNSFLADLARVADDTFNVRKDGGIGDVFQKMGIDERPNKMGGVDQYVLFMKLEDQETGGIR